MAKKEVAELLLQVKTAGEEALSELSDMFGVVGKAALAAFAIISGVVIKAIGEFREQEEATNSLNRAMVNSGIYSKQLAEAYSSQAEELSKLTAFKGEEITAAQAVLQQQIGQKQITKELTQAIIDFAAAQKMDLASAAEVVGKSIGTSTNALGRYGIEVNKTATESERMSQVIDGLNQKFGGQAQAATEGLGAWQQITKLYDDLFQVLGEKLAPTIEVFLKWLRELVPTGQELGVAFTAVDAVFRTFTGTIMVVTDLIRGLVNVTGTALATVFGIIEAQASGNMSKMIDIAKQGWADIKETTVSTAQSMSDTVTGIWDVHSQKRQDQILKDQQLEAQSQANYGAVKLEAEAAENAAKLERMMMQQELEMQLIGQGEEQTLGILAAYQDKRLAMATSNREKLAIMHTKYNLQEQQKEVMYKKAQEDLELKHQQAKVNLLSGFANLAAAIAEQGSKEAFLIQKAASIAQAIVAANLASAQALASPPGPPTTLPLAGMAYAAGMANVAAIGASAIKGLADGGIVPATPGGGLYNIGEAGSAEAVIPLDRADEFGIGGGTSIYITVNGGLLGNESEAQEFAKAVDRELLNLRRNNQSQAFDSGVV